MEYAKGKAGSKVEAEFVEQTSKLRDLQEREQMVKSSLSPNVQKQLTSLQVENQESTCFVEEGGWGDQTHTDLLQGNIALKSRYFEGILAKASGMSDDEVHEIMFSTSKNEGSSDNTYDNLSSDTYYADLVMAMMGGKMSCASGDKSYFK